MKQLIKKLNNFRLTSTILAAAAVFGILVTVLFFWAYQTTTAGSDVIFAQKDTTILHNAFPDRELLGFIFFISAILAVILGVAIVALALPFIMPKDKGVPSRALGWTLVAQNIFVLVMVVLGIVLLITAKRETSVLHSREEEIEGVIEIVYYVKREVADTVLNKGFWIVDIILGVISIAFAGCMVYPNLRCDYYCPELLTDEQIKAKKEAKKAAKAAKKAEAE